MNVRFSEVTWAGLVHLSNRSSGIGRRVHVCLCMCVADRVHLLREMTTDKPTVPYLFPRWSVPVSVGALSVKSSLSACLHFIAHLISSK